MQTFTHPLRMMVRSLAETTREPYFTFVAASCRLATSLTPYRAQLAGK